MIIRKRETCLYCGEKMISRSANRKFCSVNHRIYYFREKNKKKEVILEKLGKSRKKNPEIKKDESLGILQSLINNKK